MNNDILSEGWGHFLLMKGGSFDTKYVQDY